ncbi:energy-coupling factor ABC transporter permease [Jiangella alkaliphila]|uniref:Cobalt/nickel transport system permease protein n=1 Tax=Jiangella alkaliphila TaxID=419479 RepID=A0A1H2LRB8_9ACTN|nr:energy-coupling factor ABC transporter permease [Jiangella alkaliphila]SDU83295.1 cobalt/nickel transport system permease protein [Jiangella alkaliphila]
MHVPDGFLNAPTSVATGAVAAAGVALALRKAQDELDERTAPLAGLTAAFVFAVQMLNFPVGVGTSGHLMGGALAAVLVGPWTAVLCLSVVLLVQGLLFADGGLTALGTNISLIGITTVVVGWVVTRAVLAVLSKRPASVVPAATIGALVSVPVAALVFVLLFAVGGEASLPLGTLTVSMLGWHTLIGIGEAVITGLTVSAVVAVRPDLVYAARGLRPALQLKQADGTLVPVGAPEPAGAAARGSVRPLLIGGSLVALALAGIVSFFASANPDGLEYVAEGEGFLETARDHAFGDFALADYGDVGGIPVGLAGILGVAVVVVIGVVLFRLVGGRSSARATENAVR